MFLYPSKVWSYLIFNFFVQEAIAAGSFCGTSKTIEKGDLARGFEGSDHVIEGETHMGGQDHFYLETHASLAIPTNEDGEMHMYVSTQNPSETQVRNKKTEQICKKNVNMNDI